MLERAMTAAADTSAAAQKWTDLPDEALLARIRVGDSSAYEIVLRRYNRRLSA